MPNTRGGHADSFLTPAFGHPRQNVRPVVSLFSYRSKGGADILPWLFARSRKKLNCTHAPLAVPLAGDIPRPARSASGSGSGGVKAVSFCKTDGCWLFLFKKKF